MLSLQLPSHFKCSAAEESVAFRVVGAVIDSALPYLESLIMMGETEASERQN